MIDKNFKPIHVYRDYTNPWDKKNAWKVTFTSSSSQDVESYNLDKIHLLSYSTKKRGKVELTQDDDYYINGLRSKYDGGPSEFLFSINPDSSKLFPFSSLYLLTMKFDAGAFVKKDGTQSAEETLVFHPPSKSQNEKTSDISPAFTDTKTTEEKEVQKAILDSILMNSGTVVTATSDETSLTGIAGIVDSGDYGL